MPACARASRSQQDIATKRERLFRWARSYTQAIEPTQPTTQHTPRDTCWLVNAAMTGGLSRSGPRPRSRPHTHTHAHTFAHSLTHAHTHSHTHALGFTLTPTFACALTVTPPCTQTHAHSDVNGLTPTLTLSLTSLVPMLAVTLSHTHTLTLTLTPSSLVVAAVQVQGRDRCAGSSHDGGSQRGPTPV